MGGRRDSGADCHAHHQPPAPALRRGPDSTEPISQHTRQWAGSAVPGAAKVGAEAPHPQTVGRSRSRWDRGPGGGSRGLAGAPELRKDAGPAHGPPAARPVSLALPMWNSTRSHFTHPFTQHSLSTYCVQRPGLGEGQGRGPVWPTTLNISGWSWASPTIHSVTQYFLRPYCVLRPELGQVWGTGRNQLCRA